MAIRGNISKEIITNKILQDFEGSFVKDKKIYIPVVEDGQKLQIALTLTCPKTIVESAAAPVLDWSMPDKKETETQQKKMDLTPQEKQKVEELISKLGL